MPLPGSSGLALKKAAHETPIHPGQAVKLSE